MADLDIGVGQTYATVAVAYLAAGVGDSFLYHATGGAPTTFDEPHTHFLLNGLTIKPAPGDEGLITVRPSGSPAYLWVAESDIMLIQGLKLALGVGTVDKFIGIQGCNDGVIDNCEFTVPSFGRGIDLGPVPAAADGWTVQECKFTCTGNGIGLYPASLSNFVVKDSTFFVESGHGVYNFYTTTQLAERCKFIGDGVNPGHGLCTLRYGTVRNCIFADLDYGIQGDRFSTTTGGVNNNTFYNCTQGIQLGVNDGIAALDNNAFVNCGTGIYRSASVNTPNAPDSNLFFGNGTDYVNYTPPINSQTTNPLFTDAANQVFTFPTGSPLEDNGKNLAGIVDDDHIGTPRPQGPAWDIGAYELGWKGAFCGALLSKLCGKVITHYCGG